jgi:Outer membrane receptor proteins, mostly Fe transport
VSYSKYNWKQIAEIWGDDHGTKYTGDDNPYVDGYNAAWLDLPIAESLSGYYEAVDWSSFNRGDGSFTVPGETPNRVLHPSSELANRYMEWGSLLADVTKPADERDGWVPVQDRDIDGDGKADTTGYFLPSELSQISETNTAAYVRMDFETEVAGMRLSGNLGVRYFQIELESTGSIQFPDLIVNDANSAGDRNRYFDELEGDVTYVPTEYRGINEPGFGNNAYVTTTATHKYDDVLPSFNLKVEFTDELLGRFAVSKAVALPDIGKLRNYMSIGAENVQTRLSLGNVDGNDTIQEQQILATYATGWTASAGNPFLMPMESIQYDASLEWYFADVGSLTASVFYKDLSNFFVSGAFPRQVTNPSTDVTETVNVNGVVNSGDGSMSGFELAYQQTYDSLPEPFDGLGTQFNYTYIDAKSVPNPDLAGDPTVDLSDSELADREGIAYTGLPLESQSRHTANAVVFWQKNDWDARLAYNWRSGYLVTARDVINPYRPIWSAAAGYLDGSIFYNVTDELRVGFQGQNLLNTVTKTEMQISEDGYTQGRSWFTNDRRYSLIVRLNF